MEVDQPKGRAKTTKRRGRTAKRSKPAGFLTLFKRFPSLEPFIFEKVYDERTTECLVFSPLSDGRIPEMALPYCIQTVSTMTSEVLETLVGPDSFVFVVRKDRENEGRRQAFVASGPIVMGGSGFLFAITDCSVEHAVLSFENEVSTDFSTPPTSEDETIPPWEEKPVAVRKQPGKTPKLTLQEIPAFRPKSAATTTIKPVEPTKPLQPTTPAIRSAEPSQPLPSTSLPVPEPSQTAPAVSQRSALASQPDNATGAPPGRRRKNRVRFRNVDFSKLTVTVPAAPAVNTVLVKPTNKTDCLRQVNPKLFLQDLCRQGDYIGLRDIRDGGFALDYPLGVDLTKILTITTAAGIPVAVTRPREAISSCAAVLSGVHPDLTNEELMEDIQTIPAAEITEVKRLARPGQSSWSVKVTFKGTTLPERALLYGRSRRLVLYKDKPLQCLKCGRYAHSARVCRSSPRCWTCSEAHETSTCPNKTQPRCPNCGGAHAADAVICPARGFQVKVCEVRAASRVPHKQAREAVAKAAKSYADVARPAQPSRPSPQQQQQPRPARAPQPAGPNYIQNIAHPRPPTSKESTVTHRQLVDLFKGLLELLTAAIVTGDIAGAIPGITTLFQQQAPGADPGLFAV